MGIFGKKEAAVPQQGMPSSPLQPVEQVAAMKQQGYTNSQIISSLQRDGYSSSQIFDALNQVEMRMGTPIDGSATSPDFNDMNINMPQGTPAMPPQYPEFEQQQQMQQALPPLPKSSQSAQMQQPHQQQVPFTNDAAVEELVESVIDEKWNELVKDLNKIIDWKNSTEERMVSLEQQFKDMKEQFERLHAGVLGKISDYDKNIQDVGAEIKAMEKVFSKVLPVFTDNVSELSRITDRIKSSGKK